MEKYLYEPKRHDPAIHFYANDVDGKWYVKQYNSTAAPFPTDEVVLVAITEEWAQRAATALTVFPQIIDLCGSVAQKSDDAGWLK